MRNGFLQALAVCMFTIANSYASADQIITLRAELPTLRLGDGADRVTTEQRSVCVKNVDAKSEEKSALSQELNIEIFNSFKQLSNVLGASAYAAYFGPLSKFSAELAKYTSESSVTEGGRFYLKLVVTGATTRLVGVEPSDQALQALELDPTGALFASACGDSFVYQVSQGAEFLAVVSHSLMDEQTRANFLADLRAEYGGSNASVEIRQRLENVSRQYEMRVQIRQIGLQSKPVPSVTDVSQMIEFARTFASEVNKTKEFASYQAHLQRYSESLAFKLATAGARKHRLINFDPSLPIMEQYVEAYDLAVFRANKTRRALSDPSLFRRFDKSTFEKYEPIIRDAVSRLANLAKSCAQATQNGQNCLLDNSLVVPPFPEPLEELPICASVIAGSEGCQQVAQVGGKCHCVKCSFGSQRYENLGESSYVYGKCDNMKPGAEVRASFVGTIGHAFSPTDSWYQFEFGSVDEFRDQYTPIKHYEKSFDAIVPESGQFEVRAGYAFCTGNTSIEQSRICILRPDSRAFMIEVESSGIQ